MKSSKALWRTTWAVAVGAAIAPISTRAQSGPPDFSQVSIKTTNLAGNVYELVGRGGSIGVLTGPDGILMVDAEFAPLTPKIVEAIRQFSNQPIRFLVNTHDHGDHTGGNENLAKMGAVIVAREEVRDRLMHPGPGPNGTPGTPAPAVALPMITFEGKMQFHLDGEDVQLIPIPRAHTNNDTLVYFPHADVIMAGDYFNSDQYPYIDRADGGSLKGMLDGMSVLVGLAGPNTKIMPGHGPVVGKKEAIEIQEMIVAIRDRVAPMVAQGKTLDEVLAAHPTADYDTRIADSKRTTDRFIRALYAELAAGK